MGMTITEKILAAHAGRDRVRPGELIRARVDLALGNDITTPIAIKGSTGSAQHRFSIATGSHGPRSLHAEQRYPLGGAGRSTPLCPRSGSPITSK